MTDLTPREIVSELDRFIIGQDAAKRAVAVALRNRWRRKQLPPELAQEVTPKNILMIGPTGVGKTEISRRLARLAAAPFLKVEATKFTEVGYVGRDVEQIVRDLLDVAIAQTRETMREDVRARAQAAAEDRVVTALAGEDARPGTRETFRRKLKSGELDQTVIELELADSSNPLGMPPGLDLPGAQGLAMANLGDLFGKAFRRTTRKRMTVAESYDVLLDEEADKLLDDERSRAPRSRRGAERHRLPGRDRQGLRPGRDARRRREPRGRAARPPAPHRGHDRLHQARAGQDRPHPVHRLGRVPHRQASDLLPELRAACRSGWSSSR
jgi:ATP-dependent HslUV protease ATP-binding subunit HslU